MSRVPPFAEPSSYIRYYGPVLGYPNRVSVRNDDSDERLRFIRLNAREMPLKYQWVFANNAVGVQSSPKSFGDFEMLPDHLLQLYLGISYGGRARIYHPNDQRILKWDDQALDITEKDTANIEYEESPASHPAFELWVAPTQNFVPAIDVENVLNDIRPSRNIDIQVQFLGAKFTYEYVEPATDPETHRKLTTFQIPSRYVVFGGKV